MCLAVPMQVLEIDGARARCAALGQERWAHLTLMPEGAVAVGDHIVIQLGFVQRTVSADDARRSIELFEDILATLDPQADGSVPSD